MGRWLLQGFQQRIKAMRRKHMHLIDQVHLVTPLRRCILNVIHQLTGIFYLGSGCRIHFDQINKTSFADLSTGGTFTTGLGTNTLLAIQRLGEQAGDRGLTHASGTRKQIGMV